MTDLLARNPTDLLERNSRVSESQCPSLSNPASKIKSPSSPISSDKPKRTHAMTCSFKTSFGTPPAKVERAGVSPPPASPQRSPSSLPQQPSSSNLAEDNRILVERMGNHDDDDELGHPGESSEGSATSASGTTITSPHPCSSPETGTSSSKPAINQAEMKQMDKVDHQAEQAAQAPVASSRQQGDGGQGPIVKPSFTSFMSPPYNPSRRNSVASGISGAIRIQMASTAPQKRPRLVPVGDDGRSFKFVEEEEPRRLAGQPSALREDSARFVELSISGSELDGVPGERLVAESLLDDPTGANSTSSISKSRANPARIDSKFSEAAPIPVRLENLSPEEKRAFLSRNSRGRPSTTPSSQNDSASSPNLTASLSSPERAAGPSDLGINDRHSPPTSQEQLSCQLIGQIKQSADANHSDWEQPQMSMSGSDVERWARGVVTTIPDPSEEEEITEMSEERRDELQETFDSLDLTDGGEPAWLERVRKSEQQQVAHSFITNKIKTLVLDSGHDSSGSFQSFESTLPPRRASPNNSSAVNSNGHSIDTAPTTASSRHSTSRSSTFDQAGSEKEKKGRSSGLKSHQSAHPKLIASASEVDQYQPNTELSGRTSSYSHSDEISENDRNLRLKMQPESNLVNLDSKAQTLNRDT